MDGGCEDRDSSRKLQALETRVRATPQDLEALNEFLDAAALQGKVERIESLLADLIALQPRNPVLLTYWAQALGNIGKFQQSIQIYEQALAIAPTLDELHVAYGVALLRQGNLLDGWQHYEHRESIPRTRQGLTPPNQPPYTGGNLHGRTILLLGEQGIGDTLMMARYTPLLVGRGAKVAFAAPASLRELLRTIPGVCRVTALGERVPACDRYAWLLSLPRVFATTLDTIPRRVPYLAASPSRIKRWRESLDARSSGLRVGLVWAGSALHRSDALRSIHLHDLAPLAEVEGATFIALQKGEREAQGIDPPEGMRLINLGPELQDLSDLAAVLEIVDLLISVDTAPVHLAGALARPVWTMVPFVPDWRWMLNRDDSPWYPTMRLFRQERLHDWPGVVQRVRDALREWVRQH